MIVYEVDTRSDVLLNHWNEVFDWMDDIYPGIHIDILDMKGQPPCGQLNVESYKKLNKKYIIFLCDPNTFYKVTTLVFSSQDVYDQVVDGWFIDNNYIKHITPLFNYNYDLYLGSLHNYYYEWAFDYCESYIPNTNWKKYYSAASRRISFKYREDYDSFDVIYKMKFG